MGSVSDFYPVHSNTKPAPKTGGRCAKMCRESSRQQYRGSRRRGRMASKTYAVDKGVIFCHLQNAPKKCRSVLGRKTQDPKLGFKNPDLYGRVVQPTTQNSTSGLTLAQSCNFTMILPIGDFRCNSDWERAAGS